MPRECNPYLRDFAPVAGREIKVLAGCTITSGTGLLLLDAIGRAIGPVHDISAGKREQTCIDFDPCTNASRRS